MGRGEREFLPAQAGSQKVCQWEVGSPEGRPRRNVVRRRPTEAAIRPARFVWIEAKHKKREIEVENFAPLSALFATKDQAPMYGIAKYGPQNDLTFAFS